MIASFRVNDRKIFQIKMLNCFTHHSGLCRVHVSRTTWLGFSLSLLGFKCQPFIELFCFQWQKDGQEKHPRYQYSACEFGKCVCVCVRVCDACFLKIIYHLINALDVCHERMTSETKHQHSLFQCLDKYVNSLKVCFQIFNIIS